MRLVLFVVLLLFLLGCSSEPITPEYNFSKLQFNAYNVTISNSVHLTNFSREVDRVMDTISFSIKNEEPFDLECAAYLYLYGDLENTTKRGVIGQIPAGNDVNANIKFEMPLGNASLKLVPACTKI